VEKKGQGRPCPGQVPALELINNVGSKHESVTAIGTPGISIDSAESHAVFDMVPTEFNSANDILPQIILRGCRRRIDAVFASEAANADPAKAFVDITRDVFEAAVEA